MFNFLKNISFERGLHRVASPRHPNPAASPPVNFFVFIKIEDTLYELSFSFKENKNYFFKRKRGLYSPRTVLNENII